jgi:hypothetical protein
MPAKGLVIMFKPSGESKNTSGNADHPNKKYINILGNSTDLVE